MSQFLKKTLIQAPFLKNIVKYFGSTSELAEIAKNLRKSWINFN